MIKVLNITYSQTLLDLRQDLESKRRAFQEETAAVRAGILRMAGPLPDTEAFREAVERFSKFLLDSLGSRGASRQKPYG